jgi:hypothetical protein
MSINYPFSIPLKLMLIYQYININIVLTMGKLRALIYHIDRHSHVYHSNSTERFTYLSSMQNIFKCSLIDEK